MDENDNLKYIIESLLFVSDTPIMLKQIHYIMPDVKMSAIRKAVEALSQEYNERGGSFYLSNVAGGIQLRTRPKYKDWIKRFIKSRPMRLSRAAIEALSIVAYKQPVTRSEVDKIRGVDSGAIMKTLVENKLIRIIGRKEVAGRPMLYTTSRRFLEVFDLNDLKDLPAPDDLEIDDADSQEILENNNENTENTDQNLDCEQDSEEKDNSTIEEKPLAEMKAESSVADVVSSENLNDPASEDHSSAEINAESSVVDVVFTENIKDPASEDHSSAEIKAESSVVDVVSTENTNIPAFEEDSLAEMEADTPIVDVISTEDTNIPAFEEDPSAEMKADTSVVDVVSTENIKEPEIEEEFPDKMEAEVTVANDVSTKNMDKSTIEEDYLAEMEDESAIDDEMPITIMKGHSTKKESTKDQSKSFFEGQET